MFSEKACVSLLRRRSRKMRHTDFWITDDYHFNGFECNPPLNALLSKKMTKWGLIGRSVLCCYPVLRRLRQHSRKHSTDFLWTVEDWIY